MDFGSDWGIVACQVTLSRAPNPTRVRLPELSAVNARSHNQEFSRYRIDSLFMIVFC